MTRIHSRAAFGQALLPRTSAAVSAVALAGSVLMAGAPQNSSAANLTELSGIVPGYRTSNHLQRMPTADFDRDGLADVLLLGTTNYSDVMQIAGFQSGSGWRIKQAIVPEYPNYYYADPHIATWTDTDGAHLLYAKGTLVTIYSGWPLVVDRQYQINFGSEIGDMKVADVDNNGTFELITAIRYSTEGLVAYSLDTGAPLWTAATPTNYYSKLEVGQADGDPALEMFLTGTPGTIVDGVTRSAEWSYKDGFGPLIEVGRFGGTSNRFASINNRLLMFQSQPWSPVWDMVDINAASSAVADTDGDNIDELILVSETFPRSVREIDVQTQSNRSLLEDWNVMVIAAADFDGDPSKEVVIGLETGYPQDQVNSFRVINATSGANEFSFPAHAPGPYVAGGFVPGSGTLDIVFGSGSRTSYPGVITRMDAATGATRWQITGDASPLNMNQVRQLQITKMQGHAEPVALALGFGNFNYNGQVAALNVSNGNLLWSVSSSNGGLPQDVYPLAMAPVDIDGDTFTESLLVCTSESRLRQIDTTTQSPTWSSVAMAGECRGAMQLTSGGRTQLVAIMSGALRAYDAQTRLLSWSLPFNDNLTSATYIEHGASGPELALFNDTGISFHDVETRTLLRTINFSNQSPISAVAQAEGASIHDLAVSINDNIHVVDGISGEIRASSNAVGLSAGQGNQLAIWTNPDGSILVGTGSEVAVFTHRLDGLTDELFADGFESASP